MFRIAISVRVWLHFSELKNGLIIYLGCVRATYWPVMELIQFEFANIFFSINGGCSRQFRLNLVRQTFAYTTENVFADCSHICATGQLSAAHILRVRSTTHAGVSKYSLAPTAQNNERMLKPPHSIWSVIRQARRAVFLWNTCSMFWIVVRKKNTFSRLTKVACSVRRTKLYCSTTASTTRYKWRL